MSQVLPVAAIGTALRGALAEWLQSPRGGAAASGAGFQAPQSSAGVQVKLLHVAIPQELRSGPRPPRSAGGELQPAAEGPAGVELEYLVWAQSAQAAEEEQLIGGVLEWLQRTPIVELEAGGATWRVVLTRIELTREEAIKLWSAPGTAGRAVLAFKARAAGVGT